MTTASGAAKNVIVGLTCVEVALVMVLTGGLGFMPFVVLPFVFGAGGAAAVKADTFRTAVLAGMAANTIASLGFLALGLERTSWILIALPLEFPLAAFGGWLVYVADGRSGDGEAGVNGD